MTRLGNGQTFPTLTIDAVGGGTISLPGDLADSFGVVLIYRGSWCPYCNAQLAAFSRAADTFAELGIKVIAFSVDDEATSAALVDKHHLAFPVDDEATSAALVDKHHLAFPVGHSADAREIEPLLGSYVNDDPLYLQSTGFVLAPDSTVLAAVYSSGAIGRLVADDVAGLVRYAREHG